MNYTAVGIHDFYTFLLVFSRLSALVATAPPLNNKALPAMVKAGFAFIFSLAITPLAAPLTGPVPTQMYVFIGDILKNALLGLAFGYIVQVLFTAVEMGGQLTDLQMGFGFINTINPFSEHQESAMSSFQDQLTLTLYLLANGHLALLGAVIESFQLIPPSTVAPHATLGLAIVPILKMMFVLGFRIALPAIGAVLVVDVALGLLARMTPQVPVFLVGAPAKIIIGMSTVVLILPVMALIVGQIIAGMNGGLHALIAGAK